MQRQMIESLAVDMRLHERDAFRKGFVLVCGIDEAGRGPLAGPVVAAAVILPKSVRLRGVTDSKKLTPRQREDFFDKILARAQAVGIGVVDNFQIDRINILQATFRAMTEAVAQLHSPDGWLTAVERQGHGTASRERLDPAARREELVMMGLRLTAGLASALLAEAEGSLDPSGLARMIEGGFVIRDAAGMRTTPRGRLVLDAVLAELLL